MGFISNLAMWASVFWVGTWQPKRHYGWRYPGFIQYVRSFTQPLTQLANISNILQQTAAAAERVFEFLAEEEEIPTSRSLSAGRDRRACRLSACSIWLQPRQRHHPRFLCRCEAGAKDRHRRPDWRRQDDMVKLLMRFYDVDEAPS